MNCKDLSHFVDRGCVFISTALCVIDIERSIDASRTQSQRSANEAELDLVAFDLRQIGQDLARTALQLSPWLDMTGETDRAEEVARLAFEVADVPSPQNVKDFLFHVDSAQALVSIYARGSGLEGSR